MKLIIDIPKKTYIEIKERTIVTCGEIFAKNLVRRIRNGTPLPITERYKPIILQEHDAEPRTMRAIIDTETNDIYILKTTKGFAESMGMTIEEVNADDTNRCED